jgi:hypothetical protein
LVVSQRPTQLTSHEKFVRQTEYFGICGVHSCYNRIHNTDKPTVKREYRPLRCDLDDSSLTPVLWDTRRRSPPPSARHTPVKTNPVMRKGKMWTGESAAVSITGPSLRNFHRGRVLEPLQVGGGQGRGFHETSRGGAGDNIRSSH